jgi:sodium/proline symporter
MVATAIALMNNNSVFLIVIYAWTLLGISFAPLIIILSMDKKITVKTYVIGLIFGIVSFVLINYYGVNEFIYAGFIPFCLNFSYVYLRSQKNKPYLLSKKE